MECLLFSYIGSTLPAERYTSSGRQAWSVRIQSARIRTHTAPCRAVHARIQSRWGSFPCFGACFAQTASQLHDTRSFPSNGLEISQRSVLYRLMAVQSTSSHHHHAVSCPSNSAEWSFETSGDICAAQHTDGRGKLVDGERCRMEEMAQPVQSRL